MTSLREEYYKSKARKEKIVSEAAFKWLAKNVILINEKINRTTVTRLIDKIQSFEDTFGKFSSRLPTIAQYLNAAEEGLQQVITGKANDKKAATMLKKLTILYYMFSEFFTRDLPLLLRTKLFDAAKEQPDVRLDMLRSINNTKYNPYAVHDALANALRPSKEEKKLLSKIYRSSLLPKLNVEEIARQLMALTYNELKELTKIGKVPLVATTDDVENKSDGYVEYEEESSNATGATGIGAVPESIQKADDVLLEEIIAESGNLLLEASVEEVTSGINSLKSVVSAAPALADLKGPVENLQSKVLEVLNDGNIKSYLKQMKQAATTDRVKLLGSLFASPKGKILSQANMAIETFNALAKAYSKLEPLINKDNITQKDLTNMRQILLKSLTGGTFQKIKSLFKTEPWPGLTPEDILNAVMKPIDQAAEKSNMADVADETSTGGTK